MLIADTNEIILDFFNEYAETYAVNFIYLHGKIQKRCNYDCFSVTTAEEYKKFMELPDGIFDVKVCISKVIIDSEIKTVDAVAYVWQGKHNRRGLVVLKNDELGNVYAKKKFEEKANTL